METNKFNYLAYIGIGTFLLIGIIVAIGFIQGGDITNTEKLAYKQIKVDTPNYLKEDFNTKYGVISITDKSFNKIAEYSLIESEDSIINAYAYGKAVLYSDGKLFDDATFKDITGKLTNLKDVQYFIKINESYETPTYTQECGKERESLIKKGTMESYCIDVQKGTETREREVWKFYNFEVLKAGNYEWKLEAKKNYINQKVDFIPYAQGKEMNEWVWWNSSWNYAKTITITESNIANRKLEPIEINATGLKLSTNNCTKEIRVTDNNGNEINSQITNGGGQALASGSQWCVVLFLANATKNTAINYSVYYGNADATAPTYTKTTFNQTTCPLTFNSGYFSGTMATQLGTINLLTTTGGITANFATERMPTSTLGAWSGCSVVENGNVRSIINITRADQWNLITLYQNAEKFNVTTQYAGAAYYLGANFPQYGSACGNESNVINCATAAQRAVSERWFETNNSNAVIYTGWTNLDAWYDDVERWVWFYDGALKGATGWSFYFGMSNQSNGWNYARAEYLASLNPLATSLNAELNPNSTIIGYVLNDLGANATGASIVLMNQMTNTYISNTTLNATGYYTFSVPNGNYTIYAYNLTDSSKAPSIKTFVEVNV